MIDKIEACPLCGLKNPAVEPDYRRSILYITCNRCKKYQISEEVQIGMPNLQNNYRLSGVVRTRYEYTNQEQLITTDNFQSFESAAPDDQDVPSKVRYLIRFLAYKSTSPGDFVNLSWLNDTPVCFATNIEEMNFYAHYLENSGFVQIKERTSAGISLRLTPSGWEESRRIPTLQSENVFVAMSFSKEGMNVDMLKKAYEEAIKPALEEDTDYHAIRLDYEEFLGDIVDEIIARIKESRFVVADVTEHKNGVYFEGGYAMGMNMPVIWMCHDSDLKQAHFDTSHLNHIVWKEPDDLRKKLANRILATIGRGPRKKT
jgi:hypothetical protein